MTTPLLVWPRLTDWPTHTAPLVYLDLNHWIYLAQARAGLTSGARFASALEACRNARRSDAARFVLSGSHYMEMVKIRDPAQRRAIADVMEELTDFAVLVSRVVIMELELEATLNRFVVAVPPLPAVALVGRGVRHAFGIKSGLKIMGPDGDATEQVRQRMGAEQFDALSPMQICCLSNQCFAVRPMRKFRRSNGTAGIRREQQLSRSNAQKKSGTKCQKKAVDGVVVGYVT
jgi:hypothetical protein